MKDETKGQIRESLDELLNFELPDVVPGLEETEELEPVKKISSLPSLQSSKTKAKKVMNSLLLFYLSEEIIQEQEYITAKKELDEFALSSLIRQMENSEVAIGILMRKIDEEGDASPRMFEVLSDLQRTMLDIIKSQTMYMIAVEENAKKISRDVDIYKKGSGKKVKAGSGIKSRGTKDLMMALQRTIKEEDIKDVESSENEE